jgi:hypothetical protein
VTVLPSEPTPSGPMLLVRFRRGVVGESRRTVHLVPTPPGGLSPNGIDEFPHELSALCGQTFAPGQAELLSSMGGAPCLTCVITSPGPEDTPSQPTLPG